MTERSRRRYERNRRERVRILPAGQGEIFTTQGERANLAANVPAVEWEPPSVEKASPMGVTSNVPAVRKRKVPSTDGGSLPKSVDLHCPDCGDRFPLGIVYGVEYRGTCGGCSRKFIYHLHSRRTQVLTIKAAK